MGIFDNHPNIINWCSEDIKIPYYNPLKKKMSLYYPDFLVIFKDKDNNIRKEILEIKPQNQCIIEKAKNKYDKIQVIQNHAKWEAATKWCEDRGVVFRIISESELFSGKR